MPLVWRDSTTNYLCYTTRITDANGRVGTHPCRLEVEDMRLDGYETFVASPAQAASGYLGILTAANNTAGMTSAVLDGSESGTQDLGYKLL